MYQIDLQIYTHKTPSLFSLYFRYIKFEANSEQTQSIFRIKSSVTEYNQNIL